MSARAGDSSFFADKTILAPMFRAGRTPLRVLSLKNGADLAYTEEIVDHKLLRCTRRINEALGTIDYTLGDTVVLRVCPEVEGNKCVLQVGSSDTERLLAVAKMVGSDVAALDLNMGCPKPFSISGGMGSALLSQPDKVKEMLSSLVAVSTIPVSCKIRVLDKLEDTLELAKLIERCGVAAIGIHGRRINERHNDANRVEEIREVARCLSIPVIANGFSSVINEHEDIEKFRNASEASSIMVARKALVQPSIFVSNSDNRYADEIQDFLALACEFDENYTAVKYVVQRMLGSQQGLDLRGRKTVRATNVSEICEAWSMKETYDHFTLQRLRVASHKRKVDVDWETGIQFIDVTLSPKVLKDDCGSHTAKCLLNSFCHQSGIDYPKYICKFRPIDKRYEAIIEVNGQRFLSRFGQPNKQMAEQVAALAALVGMDEFSDDWEEWMSSVHF